MEIRMNLIKSSAIALLTLGLSITGCSKSDPTPSNSDSMPAASLQDAQQLAAQAQVHCSDPSQCSPSVGLLVNTTPTAVFQCTAFLIASDIVATNAHCIPDDLKSNGASCKGRIALAFPALGQYAEIRPGCNEVISVSQNDEKSGTKPDYAFIRLDQPVQRPVLTITHSGFTDGTTYTMTKIDPYQGNGIPEGYMNQTKCKAIFNSLAAPNSSAPHDPLVALADCVGIPGNSGSPILDSAGNVPGILFWLVNKSSFESSDLNLLDGSIADMVRTTNYACIHTPVDTSSALPPECQSTASATPDDNTEMTKEMGAEMEKVFTAAIPELDSSVQWTASMVKGKSVNRITGLVVDDLYSSVVIPVPQCVKNASAFLAPEKKSIGHYEDTVDRMGRLPMWSIDFGYNKYLQFNYKISEAPANIEQEMVMRFDPEAVHRGEQTELVIADAIHLLENKPFYTGDLSKCEQ
jgi:V8-like Glu-specific endopeptidase